MSIDWSALKFPKGTPRIVTKLARKKELDKAEELFRLAVRVRDFHRCRRCHHAVKPGAVDPMHRAEVHHLKKRSTHKAFRLSVDHAVCLCARCHQLIEAGLIQQIGSTAATVKFTRRKVGA